MMQKLLHLDKLVLGLMSVGLCGRLSAQIVNGPSVDLAAPALAGHASLPQNNLPGNDLSLALTRAQQAAAAKSITSSPGVDIVTFDEPEAGITPTLVSNMYRRQACSADAIIVGHPNAWLFHPASSGTAVYADYDMVVDAIIKDNQVTPYIKGSHIVITRPGGTITIGPGPMNQAIYKYEAFPLWQQGSAYLVFMRYIASTGAFQPLDAFSTFSGAGSSWTVARKAYSRNSAFNFDRSGLERSIRNWISSCQK